MLTKLNGVVATAAVLALSFGVTGCGNGSSSATTGTLTPNGKHRTIIFVWDGLRPDSVDATNTPTLYNLSKTGSVFTDNHSTYPTYTMADGAAFATGSTIGTTGFNGNAGLGRCVPGAGACGASALCGDVPGRARHA